MSLDPVRDRWFLGTLMHFHITAADSDGTVSVIEQTMPAGFSPPRHVHAHEDAVIVVLEGELTVELGGTTRRVRAGESAFLPRRIAHSFHAEVASRILEIATPGGAESFYTENGTPAERRELPAPAPPDIAKLVATAKARDVEIVGPPMGH